MLLAEGDELMLNIIMKEGWIQNDLTFGAFFSIFQSFAQKMGDDLMLNVIMKEGWIQNDGRRVLMDDRLLGHRPFSDLSFAQKNMLATRFYLLKLTFSISDFSS